MYLNKLIEIEKTIQSSPIRIYLKNNNNRNSFFEEEKVKLDEISNTIEINKKNLNNPLKIVVLGEVKAGKSTLVNSLIGKEVSYTNVVEATAAILEVKYSEKEEIIISKNKGADISLNSLNELDEIINKNKDNQKFFESINKISILTDTERLKEVTLVDTPGLNTVTAENEKRTEDYIANADVILWVLNCHHLGQSDVYEKIDKVLDYGKPIICILNRIDEAESNPNKLIEYVDGEMGYMFNRIFATSAKEAWDGYSKNDELKIKNSNIEELYNYIITDIERNADQVQLKSIIDSTNMKTSQDLNIHKKAQAKIQGVIQNLDNDIKHFEDINNRIKDIVNIKVDEWIEREFFKEEKSNLINSKKASEFRNLIEEYSNSEYLQNIINCKYENLNTYITDEWRNSTEKFIKRQSVEKIASLESINKYNMIISENNQTNDLISGIKQGGVTAGAVGLGLAGYAAFLGPASAYVTLGSALSTIMPPVLIVGLVGGVVWKFMNKEKNDVNRIKQIELMESEMKANIKKEVIPKIKESLFNVSDNYMNSSSKMILSILSQCNTSYKELNKIYKDIESYINELKNKTI